MHKKEIHKSVTHEFANSEGAKRRRAKHKNLISISKEKKKLIFELKSIENNYKNDLGLNLARLASCGSITRVELMPLVSFKTLLNLRKKFEVQDFLLSSI